VDEAQGTGDLPIDGGCALPAPGASQRQQSVQYSRIGVRNVDYLCPACCSRHQRYRLTADTKRLGYRGQGGGCGLTTDRTRGDTDYQRAVVLAPDASMGRSGPDPDGNAHQTSVPGFRGPAGQQTPAMWAPDASAHVAVGVAGRSAFLAARGFRVVPPLLRTR